MPTKSWIRSVARAMADARRNGAGLAEARDDLERAIGSETQKLEEIYRELLQAGEDDEAQRFAEVVGGDYYGLRTGEAAARRTLVWRARAETLEIVTTR